MKKTGPLQRLLCLCISLCITTLVYGQTTDSIPLRIFVRQDVFEIKLDGKNIGNPKEIRVSAGRHRISVYTPFIGVFDTVINFTGNPNQRFLTAKIPENAQYRKSKNYRDIQVGKVITGVALLPLAPLSVHWFVKTRREYDAAYIPVVESAREYESARSVEALKVAETRLIDADRRMAQARKAYLRAAVFCPLGLAASLAGAFLAFTTRIPKLTDRARIQFDALSVNGRNTFYPGFKFTASL